jgi:choline-sulfatase
MYTSDHGESFGNHGIFGKNHLLEPAARVPMLMCGPGIPEHRVLSELTQSVDIFPTIVAGAGGPEEPESNRLGESLWPAIDGKLRERTAFAEFHASGSLNGSFMWRQANEKLIYHVNMPAQFYDLEADPTEGHDLAGTAEGRERAARLETQLRKFVDPELVDTRAKADQSAMVARFGGEQAVRRTGSVIYTPPPGVEARVEPN